MRQILKTVEEQLNPAHTALVVVDMQNDFCAEGGYLHKTRGADMSGNKAIADNIMTLVRAARGVDMPVVWIRAVYDHKYVPEPLCEHCEYDLTGLKQGRRCPECGMEF